jgi:hypothetical protein
MVPVHVGRHAVVRRLTHAGLKTMAWLFMMSSIVRLVLRVRRLRRRHAVVHETAIVPRAVCTEEH